MVQQNCLRERDYEFQETNSETGVHREERISAENLKAVGHSCDLKNQKMTQKLGRIFGLFKENSFVVIIMNLFICDVFLSTRL